MFLSAYRGSLHILTLFWYLIIYVLSGILHTFVKFYKIQGKFYLGLLCWLNGKESTINAWHSRSLAILTPEISLWRVISFSTVDSRIWEPTLFKNTQVQEISMEKILSAFSSLSICLVPLCLSVCLSKLETSVMTLRQ